MRLYTFIFLAISFCYKTRAESVIVEYVATENFPPNDDVAFVMFYAPWCEECQQLTKIMEKCDEAMKNEDIPVQFGQIDCTKPENEETCDEHYAVGYPKLKVFREKAYVVDYTGAPDEASIISFLTEELRLLPSEDLGNVENFEKFVKEQKSSFVIGIFQGRSKLRSLFFTLAGKLRGNVRFAHLTELVLQNGTKKVDEGIILFRPVHLHNIFEENYLIYSGEEDIEAVHQFIQKNYHGLVGVRNRGNLRNFGKPLIVVYFEVDFKVNLKTTKYWRNRVLKVAREFDSLTFAVSSWYEFDDEIDKLPKTEEEEKSMPPAVNAFDSEDKKYMMKDTFSVENLTKFCREFLAGDVKPHVKSEDVPEKNDGPVKIAVAKNFDEEIMNNGKDTIIEFYAPWCGHCKRFEPTYREFAKAMEGEDVAVYKFDGTANQVPGIFQVGGFPTIYWMSKNRKNKPELYEHGRELRDLIEFVAQRASSELKKWNRKGQTKKTSKEEL